jgi:hypothetical protein
VPPEDALTASVLNKGKIRKKKPKTVMEGAEGQIDLAKESPDKPKFKVTNYNLGKELKRRQIANQ